MHPALRPCRPADNREIRLGHDEAAICIALTAPSLTASCCGVVVIGRIIVITMNEGHQIADVMWGAGSFYASEHGRDI